MSRIFYTTITSPKRAVQVLAKLVLELDWVRDPKGYRLVEIGRPKRLLVVRNGKGREPKDFEHYQPLIVTDSLFNIFANTATTAQGVLEFVQRFGPLTWNGWFAEEGEDVNLAISDASHMRQLLSYVSGAQRREHLPFSPHQATRLSFMQAQVIWDPAMKAPKWEIRPSSLLDALWLQLGQALTSGAQIHQCHHCGKWFETGRGAGRRLDAKFCSDEHRVSFNSLKRSREK
jgi:hypothetical protein